MERAPRSRYRTPAEVARETVRPTPYPDRRGGVRPPGHTPERSPMDTHPEPPEGVPLETRRMALGAQAQSTAPGVEPLDRDALFHQLGPLVGAIFTALLGLAISQADGQSLELLAN